MRSSIITTTFYALMIFISLVSFFRYIYFVHGSFELFERTDQDGKVRMVIGIALFFS